MNIFEKVASSLGNALDFILGEDIQKRTDKITGNYQYPDRYNF